MIGTTTHSPRDALPAPSIQRPRVLYAMLDGERPTAGLLRAFALSRVLEGDVHVLRVLPATQQISPLFPQQGALDALAAVDQAIAAGRETPALVAAVLGDHVLAERILVRVGDFIEHVVASAAELKPELIVMSPQEGHLGVLVTILARATGVPVLVAREAGRRETIIAASDLIAPQYPVLRRAAKLGVHLDAAVVGVHNVRPSNPVPRLESRRETIARVWAELRVDAEAVVTSEDDPIAAILREVEARDADIVVVGTHRRSRFARMVAGSSVASRLVSQAQRSVLVTPFDR